MEKIKILYIDDMPESELARFLNEYKNPDFVTEYSEIEFDASKGYENLINQSEVKSANIIFIDSMLFENKTVSNGKFTGEEFRIILKKYYPFIEVIVITQKGDDQQLGKLLKYKYNEHTTSADYYESSLQEHIKSAVNSIQLYRQLAEKLKDNNVWDEVLINKVLNSLEGLSVYDELSKTDIDNLICAFKELKGC